MLKSLANLFKGKTAAEETTEEKTEEVIETTIEETETVEEKPAGTVADASAAVIADLQGQVEQLGAELTTAQTALATAETERDSALTELAQFGATTAERTNVLAETKQLYSWYQNSQKLGVLGAKADASEQEEKPKPVSSVTQEAREMQASKKPKKK